VDAIALLDIDAGASMDVDVTGTADMDSTGAMSLDAGAASNFTTTAGILTLDGAGGVNIIGNASEVDITTTGPVDINSGIGTWDGTSLAFTVTGGTLSLNGDGTNDIDIVNAGAAIDVDSDTFTLDATDTILLNATNDLDITSNIDIDLAAAEIIDIAANGERAAVGAPAIFIDWEDDEDAETVFFIETDVSADDDGVFRIESDGEAFSDIGFTAGLFSTNYYDGELISTGAYKMEIGGDLTIDVVDGGLGSIFPEDDGEDNIGSGTNNWNYVYTDTLAGGTGDTLTVSSTANATNGVDFEANSSTIENAFDFTASSVTSGSVMNINVVPGTMASSGRALTVYDGTSDVFSVDEDGNIEVEGGFGLDTNGGAGSLYLGRINASNIHLGASGKTIFFDGTSSFDQTLDINSNIDLDNNSATDAVDFNQANALGNIMRMRDDGTTVFLVDNNGLTTFSASDDMTQGDLVEIQAPSKTIIGDTTGLYVDMTQINSGALAQNAYGILVDDAGTTGVGEEYAIYQEGTGWDYGLYVEDDAYFGQLIDGDGDVDFADGAGGDTIDIGDVGDTVTIAGDINIDGTTSESFTLDSDSTGAVDVDVELWFSDDGNHDAHQLVWDDGASEFQFIDDTATLEDVRANSFISGASTSYGDGTITHLTDGGSITIDVDGAEDTTEDFIVNANNFTLDAAGNATFGGSVNIGSMDLDGNPLIIDADGDTSLTGSIDDQIDFEIGAADEYVFTASELQLGNGTLSEITFDANHDTGIRSANPDTLTFALAGADDFTFEIDNFRAESGSDIEIMDGNFEVSDTVDEDVVSFFSENDTYTSTMLVLEADDNDYADFEFLKFTSDADGNGSGVSEVFSVGGNGSIVSDSSLTVNGTDLDDDSLDFSSVGTITTTGGDLTLDVAGGSNDLLITADNFVLDAAGDLIGIGDIGSVISEIGSVFMGDSEGLEFGADQDVTLLHDGTTTLDVTGIMEIQSGSQLQFADTGEYISGDTTDLTVASGADINLTATSDVNLPSAVGLTFGADTEKIESDGTDLTIASGGDLVLSVTNVGIGITAPGGQTAVGTNVLHLDNGTIPTGGLASGAALYATSGELYAYDAAGNGTVISPHSFPLVPGGPSEDMAWAYFSTRDGVGINIDINISN